MKNGQKRITQFWQAYAAGKLPNLADFIGAVGVERHRHDAPDTTKERFFGEIVQNTKFDAPARLKFPSMFTSSTLLRYYDRADWQHVDVNIMKFAALLTEAFRKQEIPLYVHCAYRTKDQQDEHYRQGRSKLRFPVAPHCQGKAVDIVHAKYHWELTRDEWKLIGKVGKDVAQKMGLQLDWGGDWNFYDPAHWQLTGWRNNQKNISEGPPLTKTPRAILRQYRGDLTAK